MLHFKAIPREMFFDRRAVESAMDRRTLRALSKFGAFVRTRAKRSMRKRKKSSPAGEPPSAHEGGIRRNIFFAYDRNAQSVVIGPTLYNSGRQRNVEMVGATTVPELHEEGGIAYRRRRGGQRVITRYDERPFMGPAFEAEEENLPDIWASVS